MKATSPPHMNPVPIAIVSNSHAPYRLHVHQRIVREIPEIKLSSLYTHETANAPWKFDEAADIGAVQFGKGEGTDHQSDLSGIPREWKRGGKIIDWMTENKIRFVAIMGYNDAGRVRIIRHCKKNNIPCWLWGDSNILGDRATGAKRIIKSLVVRKIVRSCAGIFCCGRLGREYFLKYGAKPDRILDFPVEPNYELIQKLPPIQIEQTRQRFNLPADRRRLVFSGRLATVKRADLLIDAFARIAAQRANWDLLLIGDGPLKQELQSRVPPDLMGRVFWTGFIDDQTTVSALYRCGDVLVLPSDYEPWALVINEAAAAGMAIVASDVVGAAAELVRDNVNGRLFPHGNLAALTNCLLDVTDPANINQMKSASAPVLADWRSRGDPVAGFRQALVLSGVISTANDDGVSG